MSSKRRGSVPEKTGDLSPEVTSESRGLLSYSAHRRERQRKAGRGRDVSWKTPTCTQPHPVLPQSQLTLRGSTTWHPGGREGLEKTRDPGRHRRFPHLALCVPLVRDKRALAQADGSSHCEERSQVQGNVTGKRMGTHPSSNPQ